MANAAIAYLNLADDGTVTTSSEEILMPGSTLLTPHVEERWRSQLSVAFFVVDLGSAQSLDTIWVGGLTGGDSTTMRVRVSLTDSAGLIDLLYDSDDGDQEFTSDYPAYLCLLPAPVSGRYVRVDITDPDESYVEAGRIFVGLKTEFAINFAYGWAMGYVDRSVTAETRGGQTLVWNDNSYRVLDLSFDFLSADERHGIVAAIDRVNGRHTDILFMLDADPDSLTLARDSIFGLVTDLTPVTNPQLADVFGKQYKIKERL